MRGCRPVVLLLFVATTASSVRAALWGRSRGHEQERPTVVGEIVLPEESLSDLEAHATILSEHPGDLEWIGSYLDREASGPAEEPKVQAAIALSRMLKLPPGERSAAARSLDSSPELSSLRDLLRESAQWEASPDSGPRALIQFFDRGDGAAGARIRPVSAAEVGVFTRRAEEDPDVTEFFHRLVAVMRVKDDASEATPLERALKDPDSGESKLFTEYIRYVAHRGFKRPMPTAAENAKARKLDSLLQHISAVAMVDRIMIRLVELGQPIPEETQGHLAALFHGAADRVDIRAGTWMLGDMLFLDEHERIGGERASGQMSYLVGVQEELMSKKPIPAARLYAFIARLNGADGGSPMAFQRPIPPGKEHEYAWFLRGTGKALALTHPSANALVTAHEDVAVRNIARQSPEFSVDSARMEAALARASARDADYVGKVETYRTFLNEATYNSRNLTLTLGALGSLGTAVMEIGDETARAMYSKLVHDWLEKIRNVIMSDPDRGERPRGIAADLFNLATARERWDLETLHYVFKKLEWLAGLTPGEKVAAATADLVEAEILKVRRSEKPDAKAVLDFLSGSQAEASRVKIGVFSMTLARKDESFTQVRQKVLEIRDVHESQNESGEYWELVRMMEEMAREHGFEGIQWMDMRHLHRWRVFVKRADYTAKELPNIVDGRARSEIQVAYKNLAFSPDLSEIDKFFDGKYNRAIVHVGDFELALRAKDFSMTGVPGRSLMIEEIGSKNPGSGNYPQLLRLVEGLARGRGFRVLEIEGVDNPRQWGFYERKMGYRQTPRSNEKWRTYFTDLGR